MENEPCKLAERYLANSEIEPVSDLLPRGSAPFYIPRRCIEALFADKVTGVKLEGIFLCPCHGCVQDGGPVGDRSTQFNELKEKELRAEYAAIFALLIYVHRPGLIRIFQQHGLKLHGTEYLHEGDFDRLKEKIRGQPRKETIIDLASLKKKVLRYQYSFLVRTLKPYFDLKVIPAKELLPIKENETPKGQGSFAKVHCFEFQDDDYRSKEFGRVTKFARKVFMNGEASSSAKEWYNLQGLSKATNHQHLMPALGAYWHGDIFFILQEEADMSLHDYLSRGEGEIYKSNDLWRQVQGLAEGINTLHNLYQGTKIAYHQDLKPANILIVRGVMKIADFGLLEFKPVLPDEPGSTGVVSSHNTGYYAPPRQGHYTRKDDIWSLACIISELATADIQGRDEIPKYRAARIASGQRGRDTPAFFLGTSVKNQVLDKHRQLQRMIQVQEPTGQDETTSVFQRKFYTAAFFALLNSMFRHDDSSGSLLAVPGQVLIPDAGKVAETLETFRKEAMSTPLLNVQGGTTGSSSQRDAEIAEDLAISMDKILSKFQDTLSKKEEERLGRVNLANIKQYLANLQAKQRSERRQQGLKRLSPFLEAFEHFEELLRKFCVPDTFMAFIWVDHQEALNQIVDVYGEVGRQQPFHTKYDELLRTQPDITQIISAGYSDIIQLHAVALKIFKQRCGFRNL
ncbi:kinase domain-containing protein [Rutstroemia sp. NJR-2017a WRK4]|nr:kinase domain-containing protein [Rutstroemia sp. NJR-2017a WRK4]